MALTVSISYLLLSLASLTASLSISNAHYPSSILERRFATDCPGQCTSCKDGKFSPTVVISGINAGAYQYSCHTPSSNSGSCCKPPNGCAPVSNLPPPGYSGQEMYCPEYCVDCPRGYYNATESLPPGQIYFKCAVGCSGMKPGGSCVPPMPATCPIPAPTLGWCGMHITQYQKTPEDPGAKDPNDPDFMFDFDVYDAQGVCIEKRAILFYSISDDANEWAYAVEHRHDQRHLDRYGGFLCFQRYGPYQCPNPSSSEGS